MATWYGMKQEDRERAGFEKPYVDNSIYGKQMALSEQIAAEQRRIANEAASYKKQTLADQLDQQRRQYSQSLSSVNEQSYGQGSKLLASLANRGLGTSGLLKLGDVQTQMAKGGALSELAYQDRMGRENIGREQRQVGSSLAAALRQTELDKQASELSAEEGKYGRDQAEFNRQQEIALSLLEAGASGALDEDVYSLYQQIMGAGSVEDIENILEGTDFSEATAGTDEEEYILGQQQFTGGGLFGTIGQNITQDEAGNYLLTSQGGALNININDYITQGEEGNIYDYEGVNEVLKQQYQGFDNYDKITVKLMTNEIGANKSKPFGFKNTVTGKWTWFPTWNAASQAYDDMINGTEE